MVSENLTLFVFLQFFDALVVSLNCICSKEGNTNESLVALCYLLECLMIVFHHFYVSVCETSDNVTIRLYQLKCSYQRFLVMS